MKKLALGIVLLVLAGCADLEVRFNGATAGGGATAAPAARPDWLRDPARGEYPYSPKGW